MSAVPCFFGMFLPASGSLLNTGTCGEPFRYVPAENAGPLHLGLADGQMVATQAGLVWSSDAEGNIVGSLGCQPIAWVLASGVHAAGHDAEDVASEVLHMLGQRKFS
jgi:hypothetical protein